MEVDLGIHELSAVTTDGKVRTKEQHTVINAAELRSSCGSQVNVVDRFRLARRVLSFERSRDVGVIDAVPCNSPPAGKNASLDDSGRVTFHRTRLTHRHH